MLMSSLDHGPPAPKRTTGPRPRNNQKMRSLDHGMRNVSRGMAGFRSHIRSHEFWFKEETCYRGTLQSWLVTEK